MKENHQTSDLEISLLNNYRHRNHVVYFDAYFTSPKIVLELMNKGFGVTGTCKPNRQALPKEQYAKLEKGQNEVFTYNHEILNINWQDRKRVTLLTTVDSNKMIESNRYDETLIPIAIQNYNNFTVTEAIKCAVTTVSVTRHSNTGKLYSYDY